MDTKVCSKCKLDKPRSEFHRRGKSNRNRGILRSQCKECEKGYGSQTPAALKERVFRTRQRNREFLWAYYMANSCVDCGEGDPHVLELDHVRGEKLENVSRLVHGTASIARIKAEIAKCEVVCANCHRRRTAKTQGWFEGTTQVVIS